MYSSFNPAVALPGTHPQPAGPAAVPEAGEELPFSNVLQGMLHSANADQIAAQQQVDHLLAGEQVDIHQVSLQVAQADLSLRFLLEVRERALSAYQEIMRTQM